MDFENVICFIQIKKIRILFLILQNFTPCITCWLEALVLVMSVCGIFINTYTRTLKLWN